jgi:branched-subunit amino acid ABC-type transport system permease component
MIDFINFHVLPGLVLGSVYALGAVGVSLVFGILRFANFAHGDLMTAGAYIVFVLTGVFGVHPLWMLLPAMVLTGLLAVGLDGLVFRPLRGRKAVVMVMASFGLMLMLRSVIQLVWGTRIKTIREGIELPWIVLDVIRLTPRHVWIVLCALLLAYGVHILLTKTKMGKAMRAVSDDPELARVTGIDSERVVRMTWFVGAGLAGAAGVFLAYDTQVTTLLGFRVLLPIFASAILGGIGSPYGAFLGGLVIGMIEEVATYPFFGDFWALDPSYKSGVSFAVMVGMLVWRPRGLLGGREF